MGVHIDALNSGGSEYVAAVERIKQLIPSLIRSEVGQGIGRVGGGGRGRGRE